MARQAPKLLPEQQAAASVNRHPSTLKRHRLAGTGPPFLRVGRLFLYRRRDLDAWAADQRRELSPADVVLQVEAFRSYAGRAGLPLAEAFDRWATSKELGPGDRRAVWSALSHQNVARP
jgi:hypothetical protein